MDRRELLGGCVAALLPTGAAGAAQERIELKKVRRTVTLGDSITQGGARRAARV